MTALQWLNLAVSVFLPLVVGFFTKQSWDHNVKAVLLLLLAAVASFGTELVDSGSFEGWKTFLEQAAVNWLIAVATYFHLWKPTGVALVFQQSGVADPEPPEDPPPPVAPPL
jgi:hypothetical protein